MGSTAAPRCRCVQRLRVPGANCSAPKHGIVQAKTLTQERVTLRPAAWPDGQLFAKSVEYPRPQPGRTQSRRVSWAAVDAGDMAVSRMRPGLSRAASNADAGERGPSKPPPPAERPKHWAESSTRVRSTAQGYP